MLYKTIAAEVTTDQVKDHIQNMENSYSSFFLFISAFVIVVMGLLFLGNLLLKKIFNK